MCSGGKGQVGAGQFERIENLLEAAGFGSTHQAERGEIRQAKLFIRVEQAAAGKMAANDHRWTVEIGAHQDGDTVRKGWHV